MQLRGEIALVTGAAGRLGPIWAGALKAAGAEVVMVDCSDVWAKCGGTIATTSYMCYPKYDIADPESVAKLQERVRGEVGDPTILVNNAGVDSRPSMTDYWQMASDMVRVNLLGTDLMTRVFGEPMLKAGKGTIINIASLYGLVVPDMRYYAHREDGWVKDPMYGATKAGVIQLTKYYAAKWGKTGVRVNALAPGGVVAPGDGLTAQDPHFVNAYTSRIPMGRMCQPDDLAGPLLFLASPESSFVTGQVIPIDGGYLCW